MPIGIMGSKSLGLIDWGSWCRARRKEKLWIYGFVLFPSAGFKNLELQSWNPKILITHNHFRHCRVRFSSFVRQPFSKQLYAHLQIQHPFPHLHFHNLGFHWAGFGWLLQCHHLTISWKSNIFVNNTLNLGTLPKYCITKGIFIWGVPLKMCPPSREVTLIIEGVIFQVVFGTRKCTWMHEGFAKEGLCYWDVQRCLMLCLILLWKAIFH